MIRRASVLVLLAVGGCAEPLPPVPRAPVRARTEVAPAGAGDAVLSAARASLTEGTLAPALAAQLLASSAPVHARARRLLAAVAEPAAPATSRDDGPLGAVAPLPVTAPLESPPPGPPITA
ncbi:MAG: hypothetical protein K1X88_25705, partial [Nannocystaceae bacterium]|nr:hypothetical protein [Nannocystaceae bacterium]